MDSRLKAGAADQARSTAQDRAAPSSIVDRARDASTWLLAAAETADAEAQISPRTWRVLHDSGLASAPFPARHGGDDLAGPGQHRDLNAVLRLIGAADLSVARLFEGHVNAVALVCRYATEDQIGTLAGQVRGGGFSAVWGAEDSRGLHARKVGDQWHLDGRKILASGAGIIMHPLVTASTDGGQIMLLAPMRGRERVDLTGWTAQGMRATATGTVDLTGLTLTAEQIVGSPGDFMRQPLFSGGAWRFCAAHLGGAERLVDLFREHLIRRGRDHDPYQLQRVAQCASATGTAAFWIAEAARRLAEQPDDAQDVVAFVNLTRMVTERAVLDVLEAIHRGVGLAAIVRPHPIERISRDLSTYLRQPVPDLAMADAARAVLASARPTGELWSRW